MGAVETENYKMRFDLIPFRNQANLVTLVYNHIEGSTLITIIGWKDVDFLITMIYQYDNIRYKIKGLGY